MSAPSPLYARTTRIARRVSGGWNRLGEQTQFYAKTIGSIGDVIANYRVELLRAIAQMSLGTGALIMIGGTVVIVAILVLAAANITGQQGWAVLQGVGIEALLGFLGSYLNVRVVAPLIAVVALSATIGAGATAQLGAMRINEEIDALEVIGVRSVSYLASSRVLAGIIVVVPLYCVAVLMSFLGIAGVASFESLSPGVYNHYFRTFLSPGDLGWSLLVVVLCGITIMLIHTYYGYNATGGPAGVGEAVGRAVRASLVAAIFVIMLATFAIYGYQGNFHLSGG
jgi:phospholipid/cholesterol/gamma-HCH transport system permease protein